MKATITPSQTAALIGVLFPKLESGVATPTPLNVLPPNISIVSIPAVKPDAAIRVGDFVISNLGKDKVWIQHRSGDGMSTTNKELEKCISEYFHKEF